MKSLVLMLCPIVACVFAGATTGCSSAAGPTRHFDVAVHNKTPQSVMVWLSKDGPPVEKGWLTTEQFLDTSPGEPSPGVDLEPDKTAHTAQSGKFPQGTHAILEIFGHSAGVLTLRLQPGKTDLTVHLDPQGRLTAVDNTTGSPISPTSQPQP